MTLVRSVRSVTLLYTDNVTAYDSVGQYLYSMSQHPMSITPCHRTNQTMYIAVQLRQTRYRVGAPPTTTSMRVGVHQHPHRSP